MYIQELKNSKSTFSDFSVILSVTKKSYTTSRDGNRALSRASQLLLLLLLLLLNIYCALIPPGDNHQLYGFS